jgi:digeranylgeranylglycerophospholipid reductase
MEHFDVVVVGAGPAGSSAALFAAKAGVRVLLVDLREEIGFPVQCGEFLPSFDEMVSIFPSHDGFEDVFQIPEETVLQRTNTLDCISPSGKHYPFQMEGCSVSRRSFDKALAYRAEKAGAELRHPATVVKVEGNRVHFARGEPVDASVIVAADGPLSVVARSLGMSMERDMYKMITTSGKGSFDPTVEVYFGKVAPGGYAWVIPKGDSANVGLGVSELPKGQTLSTLLARFATRRKLTLERPYTRWWVPIGEPPETAVKGNVLFAGDAANMVMATNGGGIPTAMITGMYAGKTAAKHILEKSPLTDYDVMWQKSLREPLHTGYYLKNFGGKMVGSDLLLSFGMRYMGSKGMADFIRMKVSKRLGGRKAR